MRLQRQAPDIHTHRQAGSVSGRRYTHSVSSVPHNTRRLKIPDTSTEARSAADSHTPAHNLSPNLTYRHIEISGAPLPPLTDTTADQSQEAKGGRIGTDLSPLATRLRVAQ